MVAQLQTELASKESLLTSLTTSAGADDDDDGGDDDGGEAKRLRLQVVSARKDLDEMALMNRK